MTSSKRYNRLSAACIAAAICSAAAGFFVLSPNEASGCEIENGYLALSVQDDSQDSAYGGFMLSENGTQPKDTLTYSQFYSSFACVNINGEAMRFGDGKTVKAPYTTEDGSVVAVQDFNGVEVTQHLSFAEGNTDKKDMLKIHYTAENKSGSEALVSVSVIIDPTIADSETDVIQTGAKAFGSEINFSGSDIPETWCIRNAEGDISAYGITSDGSSAPDMFQAADWENLYNNRAGYTTTNSAIEDNAVSLTWSNRKLADGAKLECGTKYGLYSEDKDAPASPSKNNSNKTSSPKTGDNIGYVFAGLTLSFAAAAVFCKKKGAESDE